MTNTTPTIKLITANTQKATHTNTFLTELAAQELIKLKTYTLPFDKLTKALQKTYNEKKDLPIVITSQDTWAGHNPPKLLELQAKLKETASAASEETTPPTILETEEKPAEANTEPTETE